MSAGERGPYFMASGRAEFEGFWNAYLASRDRRVLFILGIGFDPRTLFCMRLFNGARTRSAVHYRAIQYKDHVPGGAGLSAMWGRNNDDFEAEVRGSDRDSAEVRMTPGGDQAAAVDAFQRCVSGEDFSDYTDIVVDISAMPAGVYFPLLKRVVTGVDPGGEGEGGAQGGGGPHAPSVHVVASENAGLDSLIAEAGLAERSSYLHPFGGRLQLESEKHLPKVWLPVIGRGRGVQLRKICDDVGPDEVAPMLPLPSADPHRTRQIVMECGDLLFRELRIDSADFVYSHEQNPFETRRKICATALRYSRSIEILGDCHIVLSPLSNKMRNLGCLMAALDLGGLGKSVGIAHVENYAYRIEADDADLEKAMARTTPIVASLSGECYAE